EFLQLLEINNKNPFTKEQFKAALRTSGTAEQIGHLLVRYESEWYADEALSKWNEVDDLFEDEKRQQKALIEVELDKLGITRAYQRDFAMQKVDEAHEHVKTNWQLEKAQRIKPSLWWQQVAQAQTQNQTTSTEQSNANTPKLSNLSTDGRAWFIHPVAMIDYFNSAADRAGIVTYHIYHNGKIEKHIPQEILEGYEQKYKYVYHDKDNNKHEICIVDWHTTKKKKDGITVNAPNRNDPNIIEYKENVNEGNTQKRIKYANGDIAEYGWHSKDKGYIWRLYRALDEDIQLVRMPDKIQYVNDKVVVRYIFSNTKRRYTEPSVLAGFIGALAETGLQLTTTGSCFAEASCFPSAEHVNGKSIDTLYLKDVDEQKFINAMHKFHFNKQITGKHKKKFDNATQEVGRTLHDTHLHSGFDDSFIKEIKQYEKSN
ncbi:hypothetical protein GQ597_10480, partial [Gilliamella sp. Pra-s65]